MYGKFKERAHVIFFLLSVVSALYSKQTSPPQILEANHKCTVPVKVPPHMRKNLWHCISEIHRKETFAHTRQKHTRETHQEVYARQNPSAVSRVLVFLALQKN